MRNVLASNAKARKNLYDKLEDCYGFPRALGKLFSYGCMIGKAIMFLAVVAAIFCVVYTEATSENSLLTALVVLFFVAVVGFKIWLISKIIVWFAVQWGYRS